MANIQIKEYVRIGARPNVFDIVRVRPTKSIRALMTRNLRHREKRKKDEQILHLIPKYRYNTWYLTDIESQCVRMLYPNAKTIVRVYTRLHSLLDLQNFSLFNDEKLIEKIIDDNTYTVFNRDVTGDLYIRTIILT